jgi:hypothetical protein
MLHQPVGTQEVFPGQNPKTMKTHSCLKSHGFVVALAVLSHAHFARATPYASGLTNNGGLVTYTLNENADNVKILFNNGSSTNDTGGQVKGNHSFLLNGATNYQIVVSKSTPLGWTQISADANVLNQIYSGRGLAVNLNPTNTGIFGRIYIANAAAGTTTQAPFSQRSLKAKRSSQVRM